MKKHFAALVCLLILTPMSGAQEAVLDFKGVKIGQSIDVLRADSRYRCSTDPKLTRSDEFCTLNFGVTDTIADTPIRTLVINSFGGVVHGIAVTFEARGFNQVQSALAAKYGKPTRREVELVQTMGGASVENVTYQWRKKAGFVFNTNYAGSLNVSLVEINSSQYYDLATQADEARAKKRSGDL